MVPLDAARGARSLSRLQRIGGSADGRSPTRTQLGTLVNVAVIDTGVASHPEFDGRLLAGRDFTPPSLGSTLDPHGTQVAGIIAAGHDSEGMLGVAPRSRIVPLRVQVPGNEAGQRRAVACCRRLPHNPGSDPCGERESWVSLPFPRSNRERCRVGGSRWSPSGSYRWVEERTSRGESRSSPGGFHGAPRNPTISPRRALLTLSPPQTRADKEWTRASHGLLSRYRKVRRFQPHTRSDYRRWTKLLPTEPSRRMRCGPCRTSAPR